MLALRLTDGETAFHSLDAGVDWNVVFLLLGMMIIAGVIKQTGVFEYLAIRACRGSGRFAACGVVLVVAGIGRGPGRERDRGRRQRERRRAGMAARNGTPITYWQFTRCGSVVAGQSILLAGPYLWLRYFVFA
jgi:Na+/H+ antiporter NhaD/arsenite permease-like protein